MTRKSPSIEQLAPQTIAALETLGSHLAVARMRRKESLAKRAQRIGVSVPTLGRMEAGDPAVSMGVYATALWLMGCDGELARIASPEKDRGALELDIQEAVDLGKKRARVAANARAKSRSALKPTTL